MTRYELAAPASGARTTAVLPASSAVPAISAEPAESLSSGDAGHTGHTEAGGTGADPDGEIVDLLMWRDAQHLLSRHAEPDPEGKCAWCGWRWPCPPRRLGERAAVVARRPRRPVAVPGDVPARVRHDIPAWRSEVDLQSGPATPEIPVATIEPQIRGVVRLPRQHRDDPPAPA